MTTATTTTYVSCRVGKMLLGIDLGRVQEINRMVEATFVPRLPTEVRGLINLRGNLVTVLDLATILEQRTTVPQRDTRNVIVEHRAERFGLLVDAVGDVVTNENGSLEPLPSHMDPTQAKWFKGLVQLADNVMLALDVDAVLDTKAESPGQGR